ncbi:hypothetical protein BGW38_002893 [Lunasporangiospora selenospora]|uniref:RRM domain-containing protein n=1 Tax=Lunasporangiospora selenospora TaxID=979761 RepID=A0A9P6FTF6_9FUNG|nr:hypothetical protein BGW38_002893 [Lunasporangiospora selenospora]
MIAAASPSVPSNTLTITNLENEHFEQQPLATLRARVEAFGQVCYFSPIKTFHRVFVVYDSVFDAQRAKALLHNTQLEGTTLRVYFGQHTELTINPEKYYLHLPGQESTEKGGLISPPGSPPLGHSDDDSEMAIIEEEFSLDSEETVTVVAPTPIVIETPAPTKALISQEKIRGLRIDTLLIPSTTSLAATVPQSAPAGRVRPPRTPLSPSNSFSSLYPTTPTKLAFSPAKESKGDQPFITIQDWGVAASESSPQPLTALPAAMQCF